MNFKIIVLLSCMAFATKADNQPEKISITRTPVTSNGPSFDGPSYSYVNLIIQVNIGKTPLYLTLDTTSKNIWAASTDCKSHCPSGVLPPGTGDTESIDNNNVIGWENTYDLDMGSQEYKEISVMNALRVSRQLNQRIVSSSNGIFGLNNKTIFNTGLLAIQGTLSIVTSGSNAGMYLGIPTGLTKQSNAQDAPRSSIKLYSSTEWKIRINYIKNSMGEWKTWCVAGCSAVIDSTFNGIAGPAHDINSINKFIGADDQGNIPCYKAKNLQPLHITIDYNRYKLEPKYYIIKDSDRFNPQCKSAFVVQEGYDSEWRLGLPLLDRYLTVVDFNSNVLTLMELS